MSELITCPSGLTGRIRGMKVREARILAAGKRQRASSQIDELLGSCWEETIDPGPYGFDGDTVDWSEVLQGDRFFALLQIRALGLGPDYAFSVRCDDNRCGERIDWELDLTKLPVQTLPEASRTTFAASNRFETTLPEAGVAAWFKLLVGADEQRLSKLTTRAKDNPLLALLAYRVVEIEGVEARGRRAFVEDLSMRDADHLLAEFDRVDCGVETSIEIECPACWRTQEIELPFGEGFFMPSQERTRRRSERSLSSQT